MIDVQFGIILYPSVPNHLRNTLMSFFFCKEKVFRNKTRNPHVNNNIYGSKYYLMMLRHAVMHQLDRVDGTILRPNNSSGFWSLPSGFAVQHKGLENTLVSELLKGKGEEAVALYWCYANNTVYDAVKNMTEHDIGSLVVMKPGEEASIVGIITERDYLKKIILQGRSSKLTKVEEIMTPENNLITVSSNTNIVKAMELMTDVIGLIQTRINFHKKHIRHVPVIDKKVVGMISIVDVIRNVVEQQREEVKLLKNFISGDYY